MQARLPVLAKMVREYGGRILTSTHDSFDASVHSSVADKVRDLGTQILQAPFRRLGGFWCPVSSGVGANWKDASE